MKIGLKLWSVNVSLIPEAERLINDGLFEYVELTIVPGSDITPFTDASLPMVVHAPTDRHGSISGIQTAGISTTQLSSSASMLRID
jgi:deoxyribonuclease-4